MKYPTCGYYYCFVRKNFYFGRFNICQYFLHGQIVWNRSIFSGSNAASKSGTDVLLDLLSIGTTVPTQSTASATDILSNQEKSPTSQLDGLASLSSLPASKASAAISSPTIDLLGALAPNVASAGGKFVIGTWNLFDDINLVKILIAFHFLAR